MDKLKCKSCEVPCDPERLELILFVCVPGHGAGFGGLLPPAAQGVSMCVCSCCVDDADPGKAGQTWPPIPQPVEINPKMLIPSFIVEILPSGPVRSDLMTKGQRFSCRLWFSPDHHTTTTSPAPAAISVSLSKNLLRSFLGK